MYTKKNDRPVLLKKNYYNVRWSDHGRLRHTRRRLKNRIALQSLLPM